ncbi:hypothetical protein N781_14355 [Pontibacillus halophilus JSM 076056 = DSM 19796]|uniref:WVELL protein n=1 Tax=Pontibacillus halophilus JSM 076056 = DSM 19796 TaxID=1385510 RepID=A0A0A5G8H0_9BACI|nr:YfhJ family protein [Pontibacillus halophilus]KGX87415.1 hypothetical protein N781_14355 [Pontibacillus halophilus JSM 076056 = DSM 19796]
MNDTYKRLTQHLLERNNELTHDQAREWVESLWEDFEATRAKAGRQYQGKEVTERVVRQWIDSLGPRLNEFASNNPKYKHLLQKKDES